MSPGIIIKGSLGPYAVDLGSVATDRIGLSTITARYWAASSDLLVGYGSLLTSHPQYPFLVAEARRPAPGPAGTFYLDVDYVGVLDGIPTIAIYETDAGLVDFPIEQHPNFSFWSAGSYAVFNEDGTFKEFTKDAPDYLRGRSSFQRPVAIVRESKVDLFGFNPQVGTVSVPPQLAASAPGQNWLMTGCSSTKRGNVFVMQTEWRASGPVQFNPTMYS